MKTYDSHFLLHQANLVSSYESEREVLEDVLPLVWGEIELILVRGKQSQRLYVVDGSGELYGGLTVTDEDDKTLQILFSIVRADYRGKGLGSLLYRVLLDAGYALISDDSLSPGAVAIWRGLWNDPAYAVTILDGRNRLESDNFDDVFVDDRRLRATQDQ